MKAKRRRSAPSPKRTARPTRSRRWFILAALLLPLLVLAALEGVLRVAGAGYPAGFFLHRQQEGQDVLVANRRFGWRFFPRAIARTPEPVTFRPNKAQDTTRIFVLGESAALGDPEPAYGFGRLLGALLADRYPARRFEVLNVAMTAINSHAIREIARDCAPWQGDFWVVYMGHNEVVGPFGAGTVFGPQTPPLAAVRANLILRRLRLGQLLEGLRARWSGSAAAATEWGGMEMFLGRQVRQDATAMRTVYSNFEANLRAIVRSGARAGATVLVSTVASNLRDCAPFAAQSRADLDERARATWQGEFESGRLAEAKGEWAAAVQHFREAEAMDATQAELEFRLGRCLLASGQDGDAAVAFALARDMDTLRFRGDSHLNEIIRRTTAGREPEGIVLVDAETALARQAPHGIPGEEWFHEHVHLNFAGNVRLARLFAETIASRLPTPAGVSSRPWLSETDLARRVAWTPWGQAQVADEVWRRLREPPFTHQLDSEARERRLQQRVETLQSALTPATFQASAETFRQALARSPDDWVLHDRFAKLLEDTGDPGGAAGQWLEVIRLLPEDARARYQLGVILEAQGNEAEARARYEEALRLQPDFVEALNALGLLRASAGDVGAAIRCFEQALRIKPGFAQAHVNWGLVLAGQQKPSEARAHYEEALRLQTNNAAAHLNLGRLLGAEGRAAEALAHYRDAVRSRPSDPIAQFNLANALADASLRDEALDHYRRAVTLSPRFAEARHNYGLELLAAGRMPEGVAELRAAIQLKPDYAAAHLNLGVALAKSRQWEEAAACFRETLRLDPANQSAREYLRYVEGMVAPRRP